MLARDGSAAVNVHGWILLDILILMKILMGLLILVDVSMDKTMDILILMDASMNMSH